MVLLLERPESAGTQRTAYLLSMWHSIVYFLHHPNNIFTVRRKVAQSLKARRKDAGLVRLELWVKADAIKAIKAFAALVQTAIHTNAQ